MMRSSFPEKVAPSIVLMENCNSRHRNWRNEAATGARRRSRQDSATLAPLGRSQEGGAGIRDQVSAILRELCSTTALAGIGVGFGGPVDWKTGKICCSHHVEGWSDSDLEEWPAAGLRHKTCRRAWTIRCYVVARSAKRRHGTGVTFNPVFYVTLGSGVGGGLVVEGSIYHGAKPGEAELGHLRLDRAGTTVESRCSGWAVDRRIRELISQAPNSLLSQLAGTEARWRPNTLGAALARKDASAWKVLSDTAEDLAFGLSHVVHLMHPQVIVLGGGLSMLGEPLRTAVARALPRFVMEAFPRPGPEVRLAGLGEDAVPVGALVLARGLLH